MRPRLVKNCETSWPASASLAMASADGSGARLGVAFVEGCFRFGGFPERDEVVVFAFIVFTYFEDQGGEPSADPPIARYVRGDPSADRDSRGAQRAFGLPRTRLPVLGSAAVRGSSPDRNETAFFGITVIPRLGSIRKAPSADAGWGSKVVGGFARYFEYECAGSWERAAEYRHGFSGSEERLGRVGRRERVVCRFGRRGGSGSCSGARCARSCGGGAAGGGRCAGEYCGGVFYLRRRRARRSGLSAPSVVPSGASRRTVGKAERLAYSTSGVGSLWCDVF